MLQLVSATVRDLRDFIAAKRRKREPIQWKAKGAGEATYVPRHPRGFANFRAALRGVGDWGQASERLDALEHALRARHGCTLPLPRKCIQNSDRSLTLFFEGASVRCFPDGLLSIIGGIEGVKAKRVTREFLNLLAFQARIQAAS